MSAIHESRESMGENMMAAAAWAHEGMAPYVPRRAHDLYSILGDQRNSFNLTGTVVAPATCHEAFEGEEA